MSYFSVVHDTVALPGNKKRSSLLTCPRHPDAAPIPPSLVNSPYLSSPRSVFRRKSSVPRWPSRENDEWLRDMVPVDASPSADTKSERYSDDSSTPSPISSDSSHSCLLFPPSPMLRPRSTGPEAIPAPGKLALCGPPPWVTHPTVDHTRL